MALLQLTVPLCLALIFANAVYHKLRAPLEFVGIVRQYELLPRRWPTRLIERASTAGAYTIITLELAAIAGLLFLPATGLWLAGALLTAYTAAVVVNVLRGRRHIDCGCGGEPTPLSWALVVRNAALLCALSATIGGPSDAAVTWLGWAFATGAAVLTLATYVAFNQLLANAGQYERLWAPTNG